MKSLLLLLATLATATLLRAEPPPFVQVGRTYTITIAGEKPVVATLKTDEGKGWYRVQIAGQSNEVYMNLDHAVVIVSEASGASAVSAATVQRDIMRNLRSLASAADQYFLETGKKQVSARELIGPTQFIKELKPIDGEDYLSMTIVEGRPLTVKTRNGAEVSYNP